MPRAAAPHIAHTSFDTLNDKLLSTFASNLNLRRYTKVPEHKGTPLMAAAQMGHTEIVRIMLERAPKTLVDYVNAHGHTALMTAAQNLNADIVRLLVDSGADVNLAGERRATPLQLASCPDVPTSTGCRGVCPVPIAQLATVRALLRLGAGTLSPPSASAWLTVF